jgi:hypothetical protein
MLRILNVLVIAALIGSAAWVYSIKYESTKYAEQIARMRADIRKERDDIARLRAQWANATRPDKVQALATRHLPLAPLTVQQYDTLDRLPEKPAPLVPYDAEDPIAVILEATRGSDVTTGSIKPR